MNEEKVTRLRRVQLSDTVNNFALICRVNAVEKILNGLLMNDGCNNVGVWYNKCKKLI